MIAVMNKIVQKMQLWRNSTHHQPKLGWYFFKYVVLLLQDLPIFVQNFQKRQWLHEIKLPLVYYRRHSNHSGTFLLEFWGRWWGTADLNSVCGLYVYSGHPLISKRMWLRVYRSDNLEMLSTVTYPVSLLTLLTSVHIYCTCKLGIQNSEPKNATFSDS